MNVPGTHVPGHVSDHVPDYAMPSLRTAHGVSPDKFGRTDELKNGSTYARDPQINSEWHSGHG